MHLSWLVLLVVRSSAVPRRQRWETEAVHCHKMRGTVLFGGPLCEDTLNCALQGDSDFTLVQNKVLWSTYRTHSHMCGKLP